MTFRKEEINMVKPYIENYLIGKGLDLKKRFNCINHKHEDKNPSMSYDKKHYCVHCFGCGANYDLFGLIGLEYGLDKDNALIKTMEMYAPKQMRSNNIITKQENNEKAQDFSENYKNWHNALLNNQNAMNYLLQTRKLNEDVINRFNLGYDKQHNAIIFPKTPTTYSSRTINDKKHFKQGESTIFNQSALDNDKRYCIITEGEIDCLSCESLGYNAIGLGGTSLINKFSNENLSNNKVYILMLDNDNAGINATESLTNILKQRDLMYLTFDYNVPYKDPNEYLTNDYDGFFSAIQGVVNQAEDMLNNKINKEKIEYEKESCLSKLDKLNKFIEDTKNFVPYSTGFEKLDEILSGGLYSGLICLGAPSSTGKTTFALQIADNIAKTGNDVLFFSLEMPELELMSKSLSRISYLKEKEKPRKNAKSMSEILYGFRYKNYDDKEIELLEECKKEYCEYANNLYIKECSAINVEQIKEMIKEHIKCREKKPVVFIDYLQIIAPTDDKKDIRSMIDFNISELKRVARELVVPIVVISSVNRQSYKEKLDMTAFKESGGIEYGADILLSLQFTNIESKDFDLEEEKRNDPRKITLSVLKNRNGITGKAVDFEYKPQFNYFAVASDIHNLRGERRNCSNFNNNF